MNVYRATKGIAAFSALILLIFTPPHSAAELPELPGLPITPHLVFDANSGKVHTQHRAFDRWAPASLAKMMTAYTVFRALKLQHLAMNSPVRVSEYAIAQPPSKMGFPVGTVLTIETALKIIMVKSANDITVALAEATAGSEENFIRLMNAHARRIGMQDSQFINPHGLHDPQQFTTARDIGLLVHILTREFPEHAGFFDIPAIRITGRRLRNHNALLRLFDGTSGMKTGYVCASGYNVAVRTKRAGRELIAIVFGGRSGLLRNLRAAELLSVAFETNPPTDQLLFDDLIKPATSSNTPFDITRVTCPRKYAAQSVPQDRPPEAPSARDFDGIDTIMISQGLEQKKNLSADIPLPKKRPNLDAASLEHEIQQPEKDGPNENPLPDMRDKIPEDNPPTPRELARIYFQPRSDLRKDLALSLAGATGPNPFAIKHTNGGVYQPPVPVPQKRPALDLAQAEE